MLVEPITIENSNIPTLIGRTELVRLNQLLDLRDMIVLETDTMENIDVLMVEESDTMDVNLLYMDEIDEFENNYKEKWDEKEFVWHTLSGAINSLKG
jgi:hypothetical protein